MNGTPRSQQSDWLVGLYAHCKEQASCANEFGVVWRYQVPEDRRCEKRKGRCLCQRFAGNPIVMPPKPRALAK